MSGLLLLSSPARDAAKTNARATASLSTEKSIPRRASFHSLAGIIRGANDFVRSWRDGASDSGTDEKRKVEERKQILAARMDSARTLPEWETSARELDRLEGNDDWKADSSAGDYHPELIEQRLRELDVARTNCDVPRMLYLTRTALSRDLGGMGNIDLYRHSHIGTKDLIQRYVDSAISTIEALVDKSTYGLPDGMAPNDVHEGLLHARQSFGRSALLLSGGGTLGMAHIGVLKAMFEVNVLPRIISGASAGSIVCAVVCASTDEEIPTVLETFPHGDLAVFNAQDSTEGVLDHCRRLFTQGAWMDIQHLTRVMRGLLGDLTFQEAYNRTRRICNITVSSASMYELPRLLNYITAPNVMIWSAVAASCSVPFVFSAAPLLVKDPLTGEHAPWNPSPQRWIDGSVDNDLPMTRLAEMFNVNHFIVSQVNPHVVPFLSRDDGLHPNGPARPRQTESTPQDDADWINRLTNLAKDEILHRLHFLAELGIFPNYAMKARSILSQKYSGDITILPEITFDHLRGILRNPTAEFMVHSCVAGEKATWPKLSRIRDRCAIELAIDRAVHASRAKVVFSRSQADLRRLLTGSVQLGMGTASSRTSHALLPLSAGTGLSQDALGAYGHHNHRRRSSGSNLQLTTRHRDALKDLENALTDDDTEEEERLELSLRRGGPSMHLGVRGGTNTLKARLRHTPRSHFHLPVTTAMSLPQSAPVADAGATLGFNFAKPVTPPRPFGAGSLEAIPGSDAVRLPAPAPADSSNLECQSPYTSPKTEATTELDILMSEAEIEDSRTDDTASDRGTRHLDSQDAEVQRIAESGITHQLERGSLDDGSGGLWD